MAELVAEAKALIVHMKCEKCGQGIMEQFGCTLLSTCPPMYPHKCNHCGNIANYPVEYPYQRLVLKERLREPTEDELEQK